MDALCIKMIANTRKLKQSGDKSGDKSDGTDQKSLSTLQVTKLFQILERDFLSHDIVQNNMTEFTEYLSKYSYRIIGNFEKVVKGKSD